MMDEKQRMRQQIESGEFASNNGAFIRVVNILDGEWVRLEIIQRSLSEMTFADFAKALSYCQKAGYIEIREVYEPFRRIEAYRADYRTSEVSLTAKGMQLASYAITDPAVSV